MAEARRLNQLAAELEAVVDLPEGPLAVALSGGADSAALLWVCTRLAASVRAIHVDHSLPASPFLAEAAVAVAGRLGVELETVRVELGTGSSPENQARIARYAALAGVARDDEWVLTAHTSDDQAETMVDRLLRASGPDGLSGIPRRRPPFARPFLRVPRAVTRELATLADLPWQDDPANLDPEPLRNRIRTHLLPGLEEGYNRRIRQSLATTASLVAAQVEYLDDLVGPVPIATTGAGVEMAAAIVTTVPVAAGSRIVRRFLEEAGLPSASPTAVEKVVAVAAGLISQSQPGGGLTVRRRGPMLVAGRPSPAPPPQPVVLDVPGVTLFDGWIFDAVVTGSPPSAMPIGTAWMVADADRVGPLRVEPAERHPDLIDLLAGAGIPALDRPGHPVVLSEQGPVWVPMVRRLPLGWVEPATGRYLSVRCNRDRTCRR